MLLIKLDRSRRTAESAVRWIRGSLVRVGIQTVDVAAGARSLGRFLGRPVLSFWLVLAEQLGAAKKIFGGVWQKRCCRRTGRRSCGSGQSNRQN